jgi:hypothetical protein
MLRWIFRIGVVALLGSIALSGVIALTDPDTLSNTQAQLLDVVTKFLVAVWLTAGVPLWLASVRDLWRNRHVRSTSAIVTWSFALLALTILAAYVYFLRFVRQSGGT